MNLIDRPTWGSRRRWKAQNTRTARSGGDAAPSHHGVGNDCYGDHRGHGGGSLMTVCQEHLYLWSTAGRSCVNKRDQREREEDEQDDCYRPGKKFFEGQILIFREVFMGLGFYGYTIKVLVGPKYYHLFFLKNWPLFRVTKATAIGLRWKK